MRPTNAGISNKDDIARIYQTAANKKIPTRQPIPRARPQVKEERAVLNQRQASAGKLFPETRTIHQNYNNMPRSRNNGTLY